MIAQRMNLMQLTPDAYNLMLDLERTITRHVESKLYFLIKLRASQINGCAFCIAMHTDEALCHGETPERLTLLDAWQEASPYSEKERAALAWVEDLTLIDDGRARQESFEALKALFSQEQIGWLTFAVMQINSWNRLAIASRSNYRRTHLPKRQNCPPPAVAYTE